MAVDLVQIRLRLTGGKQAAAEAETATAGIKGTEAAAKSANTATAASSASIASTLKRNASVMKATGGTMTKYLTVPILGVAAVSGKLAVDFDRDMRNVNSIAQLPERQFHALSQSVLDLAGPTAQAPHVLAEGLYDIVSSGFDAHEGMKVLRASAFAASAGLTTTEVSTKAVAAALNAYHLPASKAGEVSDTLFETVNRGVVTFPELASTIGDVLPFASQLGVSLAEVGASISTMTKQGLSSAEATTRLKNVFVAFIKPSKDLQKLLDKMGVSGEELLKEKGFQGAMEAIRSETDGTNEAVAKLFPNVRGMGGVLALTGKSAKSANEDLKGFRDTAGATQTVLEEQEQSVGFQLQRAWASLQATLIEVGQKVLPAVIPLILGVANGLKSVASWFANLDPTLQKIIGGFLLFLAVAGPLLVFIGSMIPAVIALGTAIAFLWSPVTLVVIAVAALAAGLIYAYEKVDWFHDAVDSVVSFVKSNWRWLGPLLLAPFLPLTAVIFAVIANWDKLKAAGRAVVNFFRALPGRMLAALKALPRLMGQLIGRMIALWITLPYRIARLVIQIAPKVAGAVVSIAPKLAAAGVKVIVFIAKGYVTVVSKLWDFVKQLPGKLLSAVASVASALVDVGKKIASEIASGLAQGLADLLPGPVKDALGAAGGLAGDVGGFISGVFGTGTGFAPGGLALVGDTGPELVNLPRGSEVVPPTRTRELLRSAPGDTRGSDRLRRLMTGGGRGSTEIIVPVELDGQVITEVVARHTDDDEARL